ncbi:MAG: ATP synthase F1 subunit delta [Melioribacter sp.]|nr:ATP synthase F1 subunit delta [Melioribacter sp.]
MSVYRISYRYANSLYQLALEKGVLDKIAADVELVFLTMEKSRELRALLKNPVLKQDKKKELLQKIFESKVSKDVLDFIDFVIEKKREDILYEIFREFMNIRDEKEGIIRAQIVTASEIDESLKKQFEFVIEKKEQKKVKSQFVINPEIIGGYVIKYNDMVIDASLKHQLERLRKKFLEDISITNN